MRELLKVCRLSVAFSTGHDTVHAVRDVNFTVREGETLAIVGESGCGKSATARAILRLLEHSSATVAPDSVVDYGGQNLLHLKTRELNRIRGKEIAMIVQDPMSAMDPTMSIGGQMIEGLRKHLGYGKAEALRRSAHLLEMVELPDPASYLRRYPHQLSGGQLQRVMIAIALSCAPKLLIADEPTTALDATVQEQILKLLRRLQKQLGMSLLLITHDFDVVAGMADRMLVMYGGQIVERGTVPETLHNPKHPYTAALLKAIPRSGELCPLPGTPPDLRLDMNRCSFAPRCPYTMPVCKKAMPRETDGAACWLRDVRAPHIRLLEEPT